MSIAALITEGVGPGGSIKYAITGGLDISSTIPSIWTAVTPGVTSWADQSATATSWSPQSPAATPWTPQSPSSDPWTPQVAGVIPWTPQ